MSDLKGRPLNQHQTMFGNRWIDRFRRCFHRRAKRGLADLPPYGSYQVEERFKLIYGEDPVPACLLEKFRVDVVPLPYIKQESYFCEVIEKEALRRREKRDLDAYFSRHRRAYEREVQELEELEHREQAILARCLEIEAKTGKQPTIKELAWAMQVDSRDAARCIRAINTPLVKPSYYHTLFETVAEYKSLVKSVIARYPQPSMETLIGCGIDPRLAKGIASYLVSKGLVKAVPRVNSRLVDIPVNSSTPNPIVQRVLEAKETLITPVDFADNYFDDRVECNASALDLPCPKGPMLIEGIDLNFFHWEW
jgi:hypothetical protein